MGFLDGFKLVSENRATSVKHPPVLLRPTTSASALYLCAPYYTHNSLGIIYMCVYASEHGEDDGCWVHPPPPPPPPRPCVYSCEDNEVKGPCQVQGEVHKVPVHLGHDGQGEGRQVEAVITARWERRGGEGREGWDIVERGGKGRGGGT